MEEGSKCKYGLGEKGLPELLLQRRTRDRLTHLRATKKTNAHSNWLGK